MLQPTVLGIISFKTFPAQMGGQKYVADYYTELSKYTKVVLAVSRDNQVDRFAPFTIYPFLYNNWLAFLNLIYVYKLCTIIRKEKIDIILIDHSYFGWLGFLLRLITKKKLAIKSANIEALRFKDMRRIGWSLYYKYEGWVHRTANINFFITDEERDFAINKWKLVPAVCKTLRYGSTTLSPASKEENIRCRQLLVSENNLSENTVLFLFNGTLDYLPNTDALYIIIQELLKRLESSIVPFKIFICGYQISEEWEKVIKHKQQIIFKGFVKDINLYYKGVDCFICPVTLGTGIKTKVVEAIAHGKKVIACKKSGEGFNWEELGDQLQLIENYNWTAFAEAMKNITINQSNYQPPASFYTKINWTKIVQESILSLN
jgi:glycosyltransferase involved in cell wall biosynthesis